MKFKKLKELLKKIKIYMLKPTNNIIILSHIGTEKYNYNLLIIYRPRMQNKILGTNTKSENKTIYTYHKMFTL